MICYLLQHLFFQIGVVELGTNAETLWETQVKVFKKRQI